MGGIPKLTAVPITAKDWGAVLVGCFDGVVIFLVMGVYLEGCEPPEVAGGGHCCGCDVDGPQRGEYLFDELQEET